ncbi:MAG: hypothetical protein G8345_13395 [Magnetococcales bacterium]|nr:hypothetical protein [Magnetococcales bacterium]
MQKDIIYPVLEKLIQLAETVSQYGIRTIFGHQIQAVNLSGSGIAYTHFEGLHKEQMVSLMLGIPDNPWHWISCIGKVVSVRPGKNNTKMIRDGHMISQQYTAIHFEYIHPGEQDRLIAYINSRTLELKGR